MIGRPFPWVRILAVSWAPIAWFPSSVWGQDSLPPVPSVQAAPSEPRLTLRPEPNPPTEGTVAWLQIVPSSPTAVPAGEAGGEPLHFERWAAHRGFRALIAVPVAIGDSLPVSIFLSDSGRTDTVPTFVPVRRAEYPSEVLSVAPDYVRPDSAAAARIQSEIARSRQVSRRSQGRARIWRGRFRLPRPGHVTSPFGSARVFNGEVQSRHLGTDFAGGVGTPVRAAGRGVVALVAEFYLAGHAVYIDHGAGLVTGYFHLSRSYVAEGDTVVAGQRIGAVGKSGRVTGPHLHWIARYGTISVDPMSLLQLEKGHRATGAKKLGGRRTTK